MSSESPSAYGMKPNTVGPSTGSIYSDGKIIQANNNETQNRAKFGGKRGGGTITVTPLPHTGMRETGRGGNTSNGNNVAATTTQASLFKQSELDNNVGQSGGRRRSLKGGWPAWRCMSGGMSGGMSRGRSRGKIRKRRTTCRKRKGRGKTCRGRRRK